MNEYKAKLGSIIRADGTHDTVEYGMQHTATWKGGRPSDLADISIFDKGVSFTIEQGNRERTFIFHEEQGAFEKIGSNKRTISPIALKEIASESPSVKSYMGIALPHKAYTVSLKDKIMNMMGRRERNNSSNFEL